MKKLFQIFCFSLLPAAAQAGHTEAQYTGLVSKLTYIKTTSEDMATQVLNDSNNSAETKKKIIEQYNDVHTLSEQLIMQLMADSRKKNSLCYYKKLDKMLTCKSMREIKKEFNDPDKYYGSEKMEGYVLALIKLEKAHKKLMKTGEEAYGNDSYHSFMPGKKMKKDNDWNLEYYNHREYKVEKMCAFLHCLKMCPVQHLIKPEPKKEMPKPDQVVILKTQTDHFAGMKTTYKRKKTCKCK